MRLNLGAGQMYAQSWRDYALLIDHLKSMYHWTEHRCTISLFTCLLLSFNMSHVCLCTFYSMYPFHPYFRSIIFPLFVPYLPERENLFF